MMLVVALTAIPAADATSPRTLSLPLPSKADRAAARIVVRTTDRAKDTRTTQSSGPSTGAVWLDRQADLLSATYTLVRTGPRPRLTIAYTIAGTVVAPESQPPGHVFDQVFGTVLGTSGWEIDADNSGSVNVYHPQDSNTAYDCAQVSDDATPGKRKLTVVVSLACIDSTRVTSHWLRPFTTTTDGLKTTTDWGARTRVLPLTPR